MGKNGGRNDKCVSLTKTSNSQSKICFRRSFFDLIFTKTTHKRLWSSFIGTLHWLLFDPLFVIFVLWVRPQWYGGREGCWHGVTGCETGLVSWDHWSDIWLDSNTEICRYWHKDQHEDLGDSHTTPPKRDVHVTSTPHMCLDGNTQCGSGWAVEFDGPSHFLVHREATGVTSMKWWHLELLGYTVVCLSFWVSCRSRRRVMTTLLLLIVRLLCHSVVVAVVISFFAHLRGKLHTWCRDTTGWCQGMGSSPNSSNREVLRSDRRVASTDSPRSLYHGSEHSGQRGLPGVLA